MQNRGLKEHRNDHKVSGGKWGDIVRVSKDIEKTGINFTSSFSKIVGNGYTTRFWEDSWIGDGVILSEKFPRLFRLETHKSVTVGENENLV